MVAFFYMGLRPLDVNWHGVSFGLGYSASGLLCRKVQLESYSIRSSFGGTVSFSGIDWDGKVASSTPERFFFYTYLISIFQDTRAWVAGIVIRRESTQCNSAGSVRGPQLSAVYVRGAH